MRAFEIALVAGLALFGVGQPVSSSLAAPADGIPTIDVNMVCRTAETAIKAILSDTGNIYESCLKQEQDARAQIVKDWRSYTASDKVLCVQPKIYMPSYVEWLTCFEMQVQVRQIHSQQAPSPAKGRQSPGAGT